MVIKSLNVAQFKEFQPVVIGRQLENNYRQFIFNCSGFGNVASVMLVHQRSSDVAPYIVDSVSGDVLTWTVTDTDTSYSGSGQAELRITFTDGLAKSVIFRTVVLKSITADAVIPSALQSWYDAMIDYIDDHSISPDELGQAIEDYIEQHPISAPVTSVNGYIGDVVLTAADVGALPDSTTIPTKTSQLQNDSGFLSSAVTSFNGSTGAVTYVAPVTSVNAKTGAVTVAEIFWCVYGTTTSSEIEAAIGAGKLPMVTYQDYTYTLRYRNSATNHRFVCNYGGKEKSVACQSGTWIPNGDLTFLTTSYTAPVTSVNGATGAVVIANATTSAAGLMSATDKSHLDDVYADYSSALTALGVI